MLRMWMILVEEEGVKGADEQEGEYRMDERSFT